MFRTPDGGPIQKYEDPYDPIISFSSPMAGWMYARHPDIPNYWVAVAKESVQEKRAKKNRRGAAESDDRVRTALYRLRDASGDLLYIGISAKPPQRWGQHAADKEWWPEVAGLSIEWLDSRSEALAMEARAIRTEKPRHNKQHNDAAA